MVSKGNGRDKSLLVTFILWLFGGVFGLHHFYLGRDRHAFVWWSTLGGYGMGWIGDLFKLNTYVKDANEDPEFMLALKIKKQQNPRPPFSTNRFIAAVMVSYSWGQMFLSAIPSDEFGGVNWKFLIWLTPISVALGVWTVGNIGRQCGGITWCLVAAACCMPLRHYLVDDSVWMAAMSLVCAFVFDSYSKDWRSNHYKKKPMIRRLGVLGLCACIYLSLWVGFLYFNGTVTDMNGDEVPLHEAIHHFFTSPWWVDLKQSLYDTYSYGQHHGWYEIWKQIIDLSDLTGEQNAYKVLGVTRDSSQHDITIQWRKLSRSFHPDKERDPLRREEQQERFLEVQQAYELLSNTKSRRRSKNRKSDAVKVEL